jgi:hypothetical protein
MDHDMKNQALGLALCLIVAGAHAQEKMFIYPKAGQSPDKQAADERECSAWALQQSGYDPMEVLSAGSAPKEKRGGLLRGAAAGAAVGAIVGNSDDAAKGAAIGGLFGGMRQSSRNRSQEQSYEQQRQAAEQAQYQRADEYRRAYTGCLSARDYSVS